MWVPSEGKTAEELWARSALHNPIADSRLALRTLKRPHLAELLFWMSRTRSRRCRLRSTSNGPPA